MINKSAVRRRFQKFQYDDFDLQNEPRERPESKVDIDKLRTAVAADTSQNTLELAATISTIFKHKEKINKD